MAQSPYRLCKHCHRPPKEHDWNTAMCRLSVDGSTYYEPEDVNQPDRKPVGQITKDANGLLYFDSPATEPFRDDPVLVVRVEDYQAALTAATKAGWDAARKELGKK